MNYSLINIRVAKHLVREVLLALLEDSGAARTWERGDMGGVGNVTPLA